MTAAIFLFVTLGLAQWFYVLAHAEQQVTRYQKRQRDRLGRRGNWS